MSLEKCRICEINRDLIYLFDDYGKQILENIKIFRDVEFSIEDNLPKYVCFMCSDKLNAAKDFFDLIQSSTKCFKVLQNLEEESDEILKAEYSDGNTSQSGLEVVEEFVQSEDEIIENFELVAQDITDEIIPATLEYAESMSSTQEKSPVKVFVVSNPKLEDSNGENEVILTAQLSEDDYETVLNSADQPGDEHSQIAEDFELYDESSKEDCGNITEEDTEFLDDPLKPTILNDSFYNCDSCKAVFKTRNELVDHSVEHVDSRGKRKPTMIYKCEFCGRIFQNSRVLLHHRYIHTGEYPFECETCCKKFPSELHLVRHRRCHTGEKPFKCNHCEKSFSLNVNLKRHIFTHTCDKPICTICNKDFTSPSALFKHIRHDHKRNRNEELKCRYCPRVCVSKQSVRIHESTHQTNRSHPCEICGKSYTSMDYLTRHVRSHKQGETIYKCDKCQKEYKDKKSFNMHVRSHESDRNFKCIFCGKVYKQMTSLAKHMRRHKTYPESQHECKICHKKFVDARNLKFHIYIHTGEKPFVCEICLKTFRRPTHLHVHKRTQHPDELTDPVVKS